MRCARYLLTVICISCCFWHAKATARHVSGKVPENIHFYNVDSLLQTFRVNPEMKALLDEANAFYNQVGLREENISKQAFEIAYLTRKLIDRQRLRTDRYLRLSLIKKNILVVVDYTKSAQVKRLAVVDLANHKLLHNTLVAHGSGEPYRHVKGKRIKDFTYSDPAGTVPLNFANKDSSNLSSLGFIATLGMEIPSNDCHLCRFNRDSLGHACQMGLAGLELGTNERIEKRRIIMHTTGSKNWNDPALSDRPKFKDPLYHIVKTGKISVCHLEEGDNGSPDYAASEYIAALDYIGRSEGCLVLPEEEHIGVIRDVEDGSLIFSYSNVIDKSSDYFENSPMIAQLREMATGVVLPIFATINSRTKSKWNPDWNTYVYEEVMRHREVFIHNELLPRADIEALWPEFFSASDQQRGAFWVMVIAGLARFNTSFDTDTTSQLRPPMKLAQGLMQLSYIDAETYEDWDLTLSKRKGNILDPKVNLQTGVIILASQLDRRKALFDVANGYWPVLKDKREQFIFFFKASSAGLKP